MMSKIAFYIFLIAFLSIGNAFSQTKADLIISIKNEFTSINSDSGYQIVTLENEDYIGGTDRGSELTGYYKDGKIRKIREWKGISSGYYITEYYLTNGQVIFAYLQLTHFTYDNAKNVLDESGTEKIYEWRYYFNKEKLIDNTIANYSSGYKPYTASHVIASAKKDIELLTKKK